MPRRLSPNFWIAPVAATTVLALYAIDRLTSRLLEDRQIESSPAIAGERPPKAGEGEASTPVARLTNKS